jgi:hypothetical protein
MYIEIHVQIKIREPVVSRALLATALGYPQTPENCRDTCPACIPHVSPRRGAGGRVRETCLSRLREASTSEYGSEVPWRTRVVTVDSGVEDMSKKRETEKVNRESAARERDHEGVILAGGALREEFRVGRVVQHVV